MEYNDFVSYPREPEYYKIVNLWCLYLRGRSEIIVITDYRQTAIQCISQIELVICSDALHKVNCLNYFTDCNMHVKCTHNLNFFSRLH